MATIISIPRNILVENINKGKENVYRQLKQGFIQHPESGERIKLMQNEIPKAYEIAVKYFSKKQIDVVINKIFNGASVKKAEINVVIENAVMALPFAPIKRYVTAKRKAEAAVPKPVQNVEPPMIVGGEGSFEPPALVEIETKTMETKKPKSKIIVPVLIGVGLLVAGFIGYKMFFKKGKQYGK